MSPGTVVASLLLVFATVSLRAQQSNTSAAPEATKYLPNPAFDLSSMDTTVDPCNDFYRFACGRYPANHPIPADQADSSQFTDLRNVNSQSLEAILEKAEVPSATRTADEQKIGDFYQACMDTSVIEQKGLAPIQPLLGEINGLGNGMMAKLALPRVIGRLQRVGVDVFFGYGEQQDFKDASRQIAFVDQAGLGLPERDYYLRTGAKDEEIRQKYVAHIARMLTLAGSSPEQAQNDAKAILAFETRLAKASMTVTERRDPAKVYHLQTVSAFEASMPGLNFGEFEDAIHSPRVTELNNTNPPFGPAVLHAIRDTDMTVLKAYMRFHLLHTVANQLPKRFDDENFAFYSGVLYGVPQQRERWKRCSADVNSSLGEALGKVYVQQYFAGDSKAKTLEMVHDIEHAMELDLDQITWMSDATKVRAREKIHAIANKIGYPDKFRDYSALEVKRDDAAGNLVRANIFENDRELNKIGKPLDRNEWITTPPTVNAFYNPSMNDMNFPAGILQAPFYDPKADVAANYGHIGVVVGHELTHGFDDEGRQFDAKGNFSDWWTPQDTANFNTRADCVVDEYNQFVAVDDVHVNGRLTLGENLADNGGLLLAYLAYMERAKQDHIDLDKKTDGFTGPQRFYIAYAQNWCENSRNENVRNRVLTDGHSPGHFRAIGGIVNQPGFAPAFSCKAGAPMAPVKSCRVW